MSNDIRYYQSDNDWMEDADDMAITAVMGSPRLYETDDGDTEKGHGHSVQFTIGDNFAIMTERQVLDLISVLSRRIGCQDDMAATACGKEVVITPEGEKVNEHD